MQLTNVLPRALAVFMFLSVLGTASAAEKTLCLVTSDVDKEQGLMVYEMDDDNRVITHLYRDKIVDGKRVERVEVDMKDLIGKGIVLHQKDKYVTVRLYSHNFDNERGGVLYLDTLYNAVKNERKEYTIEVGKTDDGLVMTSNKQAFSRMNFVAKRSPILGVIGIEKVVFSTK